MCTIMKLSFIDTLLLLLCYILFASYCCMMTFPNVSDINLCEQMVFGFGVRLCGVRLTMHLSTVMFSSMRRESGVSCDR